MSQLRMDQKSSAQLIQGEIVPFAVTEHAETEPAAGMAVYLPASPHKVMDMIQLRIPEQSCHRIR